MDYQVITKFHVGQKLYSIYKNQIEVALIEGVEFQCNHYGNEEPKLDIQYKVFLRLQKIRTTYTEQKACDSFYESVADLVNIIKLQSEDIEEENKKQEMARAKLHQNDEAENQED